MLLHKTFVVDRLNPFENVGTLVGPDTAEFGGMSS
jgi:hypothetical protein